MTLVVIHVTGPVFILVDKEGSVMIARRIQPLQTITIGFVPSGKLLNKSMESSLHEGAAIYIILSMLLERFSVFHNRFSLFSKFGQTMLRNAAILS
jgi:hypothetical protein